MIRQAERGDIPQLFRDGLWFAENVGLPGGFDPKVFMQTLVDGVGNPSFLFLVSDKGSLGAVFSPSWYGPGEFSQEMWLRGDGRALVGEWLKICRDRGCVAMSATTQIKHDGERVARVLYERIGFVRSEHLLVKEL